MRCRARLQKLFQIALSLGQVVSRQQRDSSQGPSALMCIRQTLRPTELIPTTELPATLDYCKPLMVNLAGDLAKEEVS